MQLVEVGDFGVNVPAEPFLVGLVVASENNTCGVEVVNLAEWHVLGLHFVPD